MDSKGDSAGSVFADNGQYILRFLQDSDKDDYMRTQIQNSNIARAFEWDGFSEYIWQTTPEENEWIFCIIDKATNTYNGFCNLRNIDTATPEVGINLPKEYQSRGIGYKALTLLMNAYCLRKYADFFIAKVRSDNTHSQHLMSKLQAVQIGREESEYRQAVKTLLQSANECRTPENYFRDNVLQEEDYIIVYRLNVLPENDSVRI